MCLLIGAFYKYGPIVAFLGPLAFDRTMNISNAPLDVIPERFHPHFCPNAADISGEYSNMTRRCMFTYSTTRADFETFAQREKLLKIRTLDDGTLSTGRQWGPGVVSYSFLPDSEQATVTASEW